METHNSDGFKNRVSNFYHSRNIILSEVEKLAKVRTELVMERKEKNGPRKPGGEKLLRKQKMKLKRAAKQAGREGAAREEGK